ncbi:hypothetical protein TruAng_001921 [Truncatella angustata]|nr:hypothetical protein TruAng_001921 [Truncatella angustata]
MKQPNPERTPILLGQIDTDNHIATTVSLFVILLVVHRIGISVYRLYFHPLRKFPGPRYLAATELPYLYRNHLKGDWVRDMVGLHRKYGPVVRIAPNRLALDGSIGWPQVFAHRGANQDEYAKVRGFLFPGDHEAIIAAPRDVHRRQRRQLAHAFSDGALIEHEPLICHYVSLLVQQLAKRAENNELIDIVKWLNFTTFDIIGDLTFGESFHSLDNSEYHPWVLTIFETIKGSAMGRFFAAYPIVRPLVVLSMGADRIKKLQEHQIFSKEKARARMAAGAEPGRRDFMTYMLRDTRSGEKGLTTNEIEMNSPILITAGSETTATALSGFFFYLVQTPSAYDYLTKEIRSAFRNEDEINLRSTSSLQYLQGCIEETLRCYPPSAETPPRVSPGGEIDGRYVSSGVNKPPFPSSLFRFISICKVPGN